MTKSKNTTRKTPRRPRQISEADHYRERREAAESGDAEAQDNLGVAFLYGLYGLRQDRAQARLWFRKAAAQGNGNSQRLLAWMSCGGKQPSPPLP